MNIIPIESHKLRDVGNASLQLRRIYRVIRETLRAMSGHVSQAPRMQTKRLLARHAWIDAIHADSLRQRVLELRYPKVDVDDGMPAAYLELLSLVARTTNETEFLAGVYRVIKPRVHQALTTYLADSDEIDDAPSRFIINRILPEIAQEIADAESEIRATSEQEKANADTWVAYLTDAFDALGGFTLASLANTPDQVLQRAGFSDRPPFHVPAVPRRDSNFTPAVMQVAPRAPKNDVESRVWLAIDHANETWAGEVPSALIWEHPGVSWDILRDSTRWAYDELRHSMMGERRLTAWGFQPGVDYPVVSDHFTALVEGGFGLTDALLLLHALELSSPKWKSYLVKEFEIVQDSSSSIDCDYDWADEAGHIRIGLEWTRHLFPNMTKQEVIKRHAMLKDYWANWMKRHHVEGTHGWDDFLQRLETVITRMAEREDSGHASPAKISYGGTDIFDFDMAATQDSAR